MLRGGGGLVVEFAEVRPPPGAELLGQHPVHGGRGHRRRGVLQFAQRLAVGRRVLVGDGRLVDAERLAELHRTALERAQHLEDLLGGAALHRGGDLLPIAAYQSLAEAEGRSAGGGQWQAGQARRPGDGASGDVGHLTIVTQADAGPTAFARAGPSALLAGKPDSPNRAPKVPDEQRFVGMDCDRRGHRWRSIDHRPDHFTRGIHSRGASATSCGGGRHRRTPTPACRRCWPGGWRHPDARGPARRRGRTRPR